MAIDRQSRDQRRRRCLRAVLSGISYALSMSAVTGLIARWLPIRWQPAIVAAAFAPHLTALGLPALLSGAVVRQRAAVVVAAGAVLAGSQQYAPLALGCAATRSATVRRAAAGSAAKAGSEVTVLTVNLRLGRADPDALVGLIREHQVDVLMLQELTVEERDKLEAAGLDDLLPYSIAEARPRAAGVGLWSTFPQADQVRETGFSFALVSAVLKLGDGGATLRAVSVHIAAPWPRKPQRWLGDLLQLRALLTSDSFRSSVLVGGDFNATLDNAQFRSLLREGYEDAVDQSGSGYLATYPSDRTFPPVIAIDHVLTRSAVATSAKTLSVAGSDHRALLVTVIVPHPAGWY